MYFNYFNSDEVIIIRKLIKKYYMHHHFFFPKRLLARLAFLISTMFLAFFPYLGPLKLNSFYFLTSSVIGAYDEDILF